MSLGLSDTQSILLTWTPSCKTSIFWWKHHESLVCLCRPAYYIGFCTLVLSNVGSVCKWNQPPSLCMVCRHMPQNTNLVEHTQETLHFFLILPKSCDGPKLLNRIHWIPQAITLHCYYSCRITAFNCGAK